MWGHRKVIHGFLRVMGVLLRGLIKGFSDSLYCVLVILVILVNFTLKL